MKSIKSIRNKFKEEGVFYTPDALAKELLQYVTIEPKTVYDPTCGAGSLLKQFDDDVLKFGQEIDANELNGIDIPNFTGYAGDTLLDDKFKDLTFDLIVANPPFSIKYEPDKLKDDIRFKNKVLPPPSKADWAFMYHIEHHMNDKGQAIVLMFPGILYRGNKELECRKYFIENNLIEKIISVPANTFEDTSIATVIIILNKNKDNTDVVFENEGVTKVVSIDEIITENYNLSPSIYAFKEEVKEVIDEDEINTHINDVTLRSLKAAINANVCIARLTGNTKWLAQLLEGIQQLLLQGLDKLNREVEHDDSTI